MRKVLKKKLQGNWVSPFGSANKVSAKNNAVSDSKSHASTGPGDRSSVLKNGNNLSITVYDVATAAIITISIPKSNTVMDLKRHLEKKLNFALPPSQQILRLEGEELENSLPLGYTPFLSMPEGENAEACKEATHAFMLTLHRKNSQELAGNTSSGIAPILQNARAISVSDKTRNAKNSSFELMQYPSYPNSFDLASNGSVLKPLVDSARAPTSSGGRTDRTQRLSVQESIEDLLKAGISIEEITEQLRNCSEHFGTSNHVSSKPANSLQSQRPKATSSSRLLHQPIQRANEKYTDIESNFNKQRQDSFTKNQRLIQKSYMEAVEIIPEAFCRVVMLYINVKVNSVPFQALVDTGAQMTIISTAAAKKASINHLIDSRFSGVAVGVGTANILGQIHMVDLRVEDCVGTSINLLCSFVVMADTDVEIIFGLDMLLRHEAMINLKQHVLCIGDIAVPFLAEKDLPIKRKK